MTKGQLMSLFTYLMIGGAAIFLIGLIGRFVTSTSPPLSQVATDVAPTGPAEAPPISLPPASALEGGTVRITPEETWRKGSQQRLAEKPAEKPLPPSLATVKAVQTTEPRVTKTGEESPPSSDECADSMFDLENIGGDVVLRGNKSHGTAKLLCARGETKSLTAEENEATAKKANREETDAIIQEWMDAERERLSAEKEAADDTPTEDKQP